MPPLMAITAFFGKPCEVQQGAMATLIGIQWKHGPNFKLLNVISAQLMDCNATIDHNTLIPVHKLGQNYI